MTRVERQGSAGCLGGLRRTWNGEPRPPFPSSSWRSTAEGTRPEPSHSHRVTASRSSGGTGTASGASVGFGGFGILRMRAWKDDIDTGAFPPAFAMRCSASQRVCPTGVLTCTERLVELWWLCCGEPGAAGCSCVLCSCVWVWAAPHEQLFRSFCGPACVAIAYHVAFIRCQGPARMWPVDETCAL